METDVIPAWHYIWKCLYWWLLSVCQISCLYLKVHNSPEISSHAAGLTTFLVKMNVFTLRVESPSIFLDLPDLSKKIKGDSARRVECYFAWEWKIISTSKAEHFKTSFWCRGQGDSEMVYWRQIRDWKLGRVSFCMRMHTTTSHGSFLGTRCSAIGPSNSHRTLCKS